MLLKWGILRPYLLHPVHHGSLHTFASQWMMAGGELYALKDILGHKRLEPASGSADRAENRQTYTLVKHRVVE